MTASVLSAQFICFIWQRKLGVPAQVVHKGFLPLALPTFWVTASLERLPEPPWPWQGIVLLGRTELWHPYANSICNCKWPYHLKLAQSRTNYAKDCYLDRTKTFISLPMIRITKQILEAGTSLVPVLHLLLDHVLVLQNAALSLTVLN